MKKKDMLNKIEKKEKSRLRKILSSISEEIWIFFVAVFSALA
ncbi:MAG: hypothetical protein ABIJ14_01135 [Nanoarchaeota archaeon]